MRKKGYKCLWTLAAISITGAAVVGAAPAGAIIFEFISNPFIREVVRILEEKIFASLGLDPEQITALVESDPCADVPVIFFMPPEQGWCLNHERGTTIPDVVVDTTGPMGVPNPNAARERAGEVLGQNGEVPDAFDINPVPYKLAAGNLAERIATRLMVDSVLGDGGQEQMAQEIEDTLESVSAIAESSDSAQEMDVSQDIFKEMIRSRAIDSITLGKTYNEALRARMDRQFTNVNLTNISRTLDEQARSSRVEQAAMSAKLQYIAAQASLF